ncbi:MAG TPA: fluoride efflux transporter CrcB [Clostridia bacterium]|nr:fluoride efflux transporter CrcB [Clostridia bacterium]
MFDIGIKIQYNISGNAPLPCKNRQTANDFCFEAEIIGRFIFGGITILDCLFVGIGGFIGTVFRYLMGLIPLKSENGFPINTLLVNIIGAFAIGLIAAVSAKNVSLSPRMVLFLKVGICGGFTTLSTFSLEASNLIQNGSVGVAFSYALLSVALSIAAVFGAQLLIR